MSKDIIKEIRESGIIDAIGDPISIQDTDFKILYQNQIHKKIVGDRKGEYCYKAYQNKDHICDGCHLSMSFRDGKVHRVERSRVIENEIRFSENTASPLRDSTGKIIAGVEVVRDITDQKRAEEALQKAHNDLEKRVRERTLELEESNTALKVLLKQREEDQKDFENNILSNIKYLIKPYIAKLKNNRAMSDELAYLDLIESNLDEIVSPFASKLSFKYLDFTPREMLVADLIKDGKQDKDIMEILNISLETVKSHRQNIRKKLGIYGQRTNLRTKLLSLLE
jgi:PAS domain S-box-containing protein